MKKYIQQNMRFISICTIGFILFILILAFIINFITKLDLGFDVSNNSTWISFYATILAAIIGGVISGGLTLLGVIHTINSQDKKDKRNQLPKKMMKAERIREEVNSIVERYAYYNQLDEAKLYLPKSSLKNINDETKEYKEEKLRYLEDAAYVSFEFYDDVFSLFEKIDNIDKIVNNKYMSIYTEEDNDEYYGHNFLGYHRSIYENINVEIEAMYVVKGFLDELILNLRDEYNRLSV